MNVVGKSRDEIEDALKSARRQQLYDLIYRLASDEPQFSPRQVAEQRNLNKRTVLRLIADGTLAAHAITPREYRIPLSALRDLDARTFVRRQVRSENGKRF